jgi:hypothetical protein
MRLGEKGPMATSIDCASTYGCGGSAARNRAALATFAVMFATYALLLAAWLDGSWVVDGAGRLIMTDFVNHYSAATLATGGEAVLAYDRSAFEAAQKQLLGFEPNHYYMWPYPPHALLLVAPLAALPYGPAFLAWILAGGALYLGAVRSILRARIALFAAAAFPTAPWSIIVGQNGLLSAGFLGFGLSLLPRHPFAAGAFFGLLTYKPHLGILIPIALVAGAHWRAIVSASLVALLLAAGSWLAFGGESWLAFWRASALAGDQAVIQTATNIGKLQTPFGIARFLGAGVASAWAIQAVATTAMAAFVFVTWRRELPYDVKAAVLVAAIPVATPYAFTYDLAPMFVAIAFLVRLGLDRVDRITVAVVAVLLFIAPFGPLLLGCPAALILLALAARRTIVTG